MPQVEVVQPNIVFDIASLMLYGTHATPIRLKILLDRLFSVLQHEEVLQVLHGFGWNYEDYARGYILQDSAGKVLDKWAVCSREEEQLILKQFLRFGETKSIAQEIISQDSKDNTTEIRNSVSTSEIQNTVPTAESQKVALEIPRAGPDLDIPETLSSSDISSGSMFSAYDPLRLFPSKSMKPLTLPLKTPSPGNSPLSRLQGMQPFDFRKDQLSPPGSDKSLRDECSPQNLSMSSLSPNKVVEPIKIEPIEDAPADLRKFPSDKESLQKDAMAEFVRKGEELAAKYARRSQEMAKFVHSQEEYAKYAASIASQRKSFDAKYSPNDEVAKYTSRMSSQPKEDSSGALDYSVKETASTASSSSSTAAAYADHKSRHLRKSSNPMKRNYSPTPGYGGTLISPSGKKRVLCTACNKTFCDKGALKIHYSAVHLKEMHKCTVDGCNMMFSSRRSRNRHSANPNPKLHMPQNRRKLPEGAIIVDEKSEEYSHHIPQHHHHRPAAMSHVQPQRDIVAPIATMPLDASSVMKHPHPHYLTAPHASSMAALTAMMSSTSAFYLGAHYNPAVAAAAFMASPPPPHKMPRMDRSPERKPVEATVEKPETMELASENVEKVGREEEPKPPSQINKPDQPEQTNIPTDLSSSRRKRKSAAPIRCTQTEDLFDFSDDNDEVVSMPDSGSDIEEGMVPTTDSLKSVSSDMDSVDEDTADDMAPNVGPKNGNEDRVAAKDDQIPNFSDIRDRAIEQVNSIGLNLSMSRSDSSDPVLSASQSNGYLDLSLRHRYTDEDDGDMDDEDDEYDPEFDNIPLDKDNPLRCPQCGRVFQNHFLVKAHYQNVHLKLMYSCTIEGCNAAFPSKRSRDRHSSNLNLHRKLLSTTSSGQEPVGARHDLSSSLYTAAHYSYLHQMARAAGFEHGTETAVALTAKQQPDSPASNDDSRTSNKENDHQNNNNPAEAADPSNAAATVEESSTSPMAGDADSSMDADDLPVPDPDGTVTCHVCSQRFRDNLVLKEHFEKLHPKEMYHCTISGCDKIFSTRKSRNRHSQNDNLHRHLMMGGIAV